MVRHFVQQPLPASFMLLSIIGFLISALMIWSIDVTWGFTGSLTFGIWFVASVVNFTHADGEEHLDIHNSHTLIRK